MTLMASRSRSRNSLLDFLNVSRSEFRETVSNPKNWYGARFSIPVRAATDIDVIEDYYLRHFARSQERELIREPAPSMRQKKIRKAAPSAAPIDSSRMRILADRVAMTLTNPTGNPTMSVEEAAHALGKSKKTIYRYLDEGATTLTWSDAPGRILTASVLACLRPKRESQ